MKEKEKEKEKEKQIIGIGRSEKYNTCMHIAHIISRCVAHISFINNTCKPVPLLPNVSMQFLDSLSLTLLLSDPMHAHQNTYYAVCVAKVNSFFFFLFPFLSLYSLVSRLQMQLAYAARMVQCTVYITLQHTVCTCFFFCFFCFFYRSTRRLFNLFDC